MNDKLLMKIQTPIVSSHSCDDNAYIYVNAYCGEAISLMVNLRVGDLEVHRLIFGKDPAMSSGKNSITYCFILWFKFTKPLQNKGLSPLPAVHCVFSQRSLLLH